jgi:hypothetical protein
MIVIGGTIFQLKFYPGPAQATSVGPAFLWKSRQFQLHADAEKKTWMTKGCPARDLPPVLRREASATRNSDEAPELLLLFR